MQIEAKIDGKILTLETAMNCFMPNHITDFLYSSVHIKPGSVVFDIGTGIGPGAIYLAAYGKTGMVHAVDIYDAHIQMLKANIERFRLQDRITPHLGSLLEPLKGMKADVIISDASGISIIGYALGWYPKTVPVASKDGTSNIIPLIANAPAHLTEHGYMTFAVSPQFTDKEKIIEAAKNKFKTVRRIYSQSLPLCRPDLEVLETLGFEPFAPFEKPKFLKCIPKRKSQRENCVLEIYRAKNPR